MTTPNTVTVKILEKEYQVACPEDQEAELVVSAKYLDKQMRSIRDTGKVIGLERIAVMAALNISHELLQASEQDEAFPPGHAPDGEKAEQEYCQQRQRRLPGQNAGSHVERHDQRSGAEHQGEVGHVAADDVADAKIEIAV